MRNGIYLPFFLFFGLGLMTAPAAADTIPRIINGRVIYKPKTPVVMVLQESSQGEYLCSGSMITRKGVLTASHCASRDASVMSVVANGARIPVKRVAIHPHAYTDPSSGLIYNDVAILVLTRAPSVRRLALLVSRDAEPGDDLTIYGYGRDDAGSYGVLRRGETAVSQVTPDFVITLYSSTWQSNTCSGDSGGPAIQLYRASGVIRRGIVGITSAGTSQNCTIGDQAFFINMQSSGVLDFVMEELPKVVLK